MSSTDDEKYRLSDHVMIVQALNYLKHDLELKHADLKYYEYDETRMKILKRFTVENPILKQKTLATTRWADRTRFLLHSKDTYLFYAVDAGFFARSSPGSTQQGTKQGASADLWRLADDRLLKLLDAQEYHDEFQQMEWTKPLRYAIVYILTLKKRRLDDQMPETLLTKTRAALLTISMYNGLSPGSLETSGMPGLFANEQDRDDHWFSSFEIPNILSHFKVPDNTVKETKRVFTLTVSSSVQDGVSPTKQDRPIVGQQVDKHVQFSNPSDEGANYPC